MICKQRYAQVLVIYVTRFKRRGRIRTLLQHTDFPIIIFIDTHINKQTMCACIVENSSLDCFY